MTKAKIIHERQKHCWMLAYSLIVLGQFTLVQQQQKKKKSHPVLGTKYTPSKYMEIQKKQSKTCIAPFRK